MLRYSLYALAGAYSLQLFQSLPSVAVIAAVALLALACAVPSHSRPVAALIAGFVLMWWAASGQLAQRLDSSRQGSNLTIVAKVLDFPSRKNGALRLLVQPLVPGHLPDRIRLSWFDPIFFPDTVPANLLPAAGQVWQLQVKLKRPRGFFNPGGFDYEGWLFRQRIGATGYVKQGKNVSAHYPGPDVQTVVRQRFADRIDALFPPSESRAVLKAISIGVRAEISDAHWQLYARTGTSHLMAISGLHIGLAAGGMFLLSWGVIALFVARRNVRDLALVVAIAFAYGYAELSGFAVPAKRAFLMALLAAAAIILRRQVSVKYVFGLACLLVVISDPLSIYAPGFMLSFLAVALLLWSGRVFDPASDATSRWHPSRMVEAVRMLSRLQAVLLFGLLSVTIALFGRVSILAPLTNMLVVPLFNLVTVPACLLGLLLDGSVAVAGDLLLSLALASVDLVLQVVGLVGSWPAAALEPPLGGMAIVLISGATVLWAVLPPGWPGRYLAIVALVATAIHKPAPLAANCVAFHALDVGQGLAVILRTRGHTLVYDTGPAFRSGSSTAKLVVEPFLHSLGLDTIDRLVISHADLDHAGGVERLHTAFTPGQLILGETLGDGRPTGSPCRRGETWQWDGIRFSFMHPNGSGRFSGNDSSCVLLVQAGDHKLLIPGDIEAISERSILSGTALQKVDLVVVPHHGSRTSSSAEFVRRLSPAVAVVSAGYRNRWGFPKSDVSARWQKQGALVVTTAQSGAVSRKYCAGELPGKLRLERTDFGRYWHDTEP